MEPPSPHSYASVPEVGTQGLSPASSSLQKKPTPRYWQTALLLIIVLLGLVVYSSFHIPGRVTSMAFLSGNPPASSLEQFANNRLAPSTLPSGVDAITDYVRNSTRSVAIVESVKGAYDIMDMTSDTLLTNDGLPKAGLSLSFDGTKIGYSVLTNPPPGAVYDENLNNWSVDVLNTTNSKVTDLGPGYNLQFFGANNPNLVLYSSLGRITVMNLDTGALVSMAVTFVADTHSAATISSDGNYLIAYDVLSKKAQLFSISTANLFGLSYVGALPAGVTSVGVSGQYLYGLETKGAKTSVWQGTVANPSSGNILYTFLDGFTPTKLIL